MMAIVATMMRMMTRMMGMTIDAALLEEESSCLDGDVGGDFPIRDTSNVW